MRHFARLAARHLGACDDGELYLQYSASEAFGFDDGRLKSATFDIMACAAPLVALPFSDAGMVAGNFEMASLRSDSINA